MGPRAEAGGALLPSLFLESGRGAQVVDTQGRSYVDLAAGFGALLLGHGHPAVVESVSQQSGRLLQGLGDLYPSRPKLRLLERLSALCGPLWPGQVAQGIVGLSGADALSAALKTAALFTGRPACVAFEGAYHGLSYGPLSLCGLRSSYRAPFAEQATLDARFVPYPALPSEVEGALQSLLRALADGRVGAVVMEPVLGRGGCIPAPPGFWARVREATTRAGALLIADEVWTGLGRAGQWFCCAQQGGADLVCLGKGLGGGLPVSACLGPASTLSAWSQPREVVHTSTFAGAPLGCAAALATLQVLDREGLVERSRSLGAWLRGELRTLPGLEPPGAVSGEGLMVGIHLSASLGSAAQMMERLREAGFLVSTGGGRRQVVVLTPPLTIERDSLEAFVAGLRACIRKGTTAVG